MSPPSRTQSEAASTYSAKRRVTLVGAVVNILLSFGKIASGLVAHSQALVVDGVHSLSDLVSDVLVVWAARIAAMDPDANHPYGHGRFETAATVAVGVLLMVVATAFALDAATRLWRPASLPAPGWLALAAALVSLLLKEALYHYTVRVAGACDSELLRANAWHHRSDALSSVVVVGGVLGAMAGAPWLDAAAALIVAGMIGLVGWRIAWQAARELVDTGLAPEEVASIGALIDQVEGVQYHEDLRTRQMGNETLVDVRVRVPRDITISEGHRIGDAVVARVSGSLDHVSDVFVHVDHEPDSAQQRSAELPLRPEAEAALRQAWHGLVPAVDSAELLLHYDNGRLHVDVILPASSASRPNELTGTTLQRAAAHLPYLGRVRVLREVTPE